MLLYRILFSLAFPALLLRDLWLALRQGGGLRDLAERLGRAPRRAPPSIWLHGASNGELASARPLIAALLDRMPALALHVTANTATGRALAEGWGFAQVTAALAPIDHRLVLTRMLARLTPSALVTLENEIWPNRFAAAAASDLPVLVIGARMSGRAARRWGRFPRLVRAVLRPVRYLSAQDAASEGRFRALGLAPDRIGPAVALKAIPDTSAPDARPVPPSDWPYARPYTLLAASTHEGEEPLVLDAFAAALARQPVLRLILAPRHPRRRDRIEALIVGRGLTFATRSRGQTLSPDHQVYLADTMGEMPVWYAAAGMTFVGGSLVARGGHTPFEPARAGSAILHGPDVANFDAAYAALGAGNAAIRVTGAADLADALTALADPSRQRAMTDAAQAALAPFGAATALLPVIAALADATGLAALATPGAVRAATRAGQTRADGPQDA